MRQHNISTITLLLNRPIFFHRTVNNIVQKYEFYLPKFIDRYEYDYDFNIFLGVMVSPFDELQSSMKTKFDNRIQLVKAILFSSDGLKDEELTTTIKYYCGKYMKDFKCDGQMIFANGFVVDDEVWKFFFDCLALNMRMISLKDFLDDHGVDERRLSKDEQELKERSRKNRERIAKIKAKSHHSDGNEDTSDLILTAIMHEFGTSYEELVNKNFYTVLYLYEKCMLIDAYNLTLIAEGNGLTEKDHKHKYWTDYQKQK
jgi:hypothetical protein